MGVFAIIWKNERCAVTKLRHVSKGSINITQCGKEGKAMTKITRAYLTDSYERELELKKQCDANDYNAGVEMFRNEAELFCQFSEEDVPLGHAISEIMHQMAKAGLSVSRFIKVCEVCGVEVTEE